MKQSEKFKKEAEEQDSDLAYMGKMKRSFRAEKSEYFLEHVLPVLEADYEVEMFNDNSFRIRPREGKEVVDFYPPSGKMFIHSKRKWFNVAKQNVIREVNRILKPS